MSICIVHNAGPHFIKKKNEIENTIINEFQKISHSELKSVFDNWIKRCEMCIANGGSYIE